MSTNHDLDYASGGAIAANGGSVSLMLPSLCTGTQFSISGTWVGTITLQASYDNATWVNIADVATNTAYTTNKTGLVRTSPYQYFQLVATAWTSGVANIKLQPVSNLAPATSTGGGAVTIADPTTGTNQAAVLAPGGSGSFAVSVQGVTGGTAQPVSGTFWQATQPISAAALPLPSGASTAAKQPALGTAGSASADVITVQGISSGAPLASSQFIGGSVVSTSNPLPILVSSGGASAVVYGPGADGNASQNGLAGYCQTMIYNGATWDRLRGTSGALNNTPQVAAAAVSATNPMPTTAGQFARTDKSGTITSGGTAQDVFAAAAAVHGFYFQNLSTVSMYIRDDGTAATAGSGSILVPANGGYYESPPLSTPTSKLSVFCATTASAFTSKVW